ncbi:MAG: DUF4270 family protein [Bacteroidales bacterium]|nr:DUF4270 family protein [Candidatus Colimorpha onthohippi]
MPRYFWISILAVICACNFAACKDEETNLGASLQDPSTFYNGIIDTITASDIIATTRYDDSLLTTGYTSGVVGHYSDECYGGVKASLYAQLSLDGKDGIDFSNGYTIDSVVLNIAVDNVFPSDKPCFLHISIHQLQAPLSPDSSYRAYNTINKGTSLLDSSFTFDYRSSSTLHIKLNDAIKPLLNRRHESQSDFQSFIKGICVELLDDSDPVMLQFNLANSATKMTAYYTYTNTSTGTTDRASENFLVGRSTTANTNMTHFYHFEHQYSDLFTPLQKGETDHLAGDQRLYLEPLGGTYIYLNIDKYIQKFHADHPYAVINHAELLLPAAEEADTIKPSQILAYTQYANGYNMVISDFNSVTNPFAYGGFDGTYHPAQGYYRLRITQHLQEMLRMGADYGTLLYINERRSSARRTIINGTQTDNPIRIVFIYSE